MKVHFIYVNKTKYSGSALKFTFYYLYYFQIPRFHSRLCFTLTVSDTQWVASCLLIEENASVFRWRERRAIQVSYRQFKLLRESSTFSQLRPQLSFAAFFFTLWMKKSFLVPANRIIEVYAEKIKAFSATNWILFLHSVPPSEILGKRRRLWLLPLLCGALREDSQVLAADAQV